MIVFLSNQSNACQSNFEISCYCSQNSKYQRQLTTNTGEVVGKRITLSFFANGKETLVKELCKSMWRPLLILQLNLIYDPVISLLSII